MSTQITRIHAREILDSRGNPTLEAEVTLADGAFGRAAVPSGASTGSREAVELRDGDKSRYLGKGVKNAVAQRQRRDCRRAEGFRCGGSERPRRQADRSRRHAEQGPARRKCVARRLDGGGARRGRLAPNEAAVEISRRNGKPGALPVPMMNIINGGAHADNNVDVQEFMVLPVGLPSFSEALRAGAEIFHALKSVLKGKGLNTAVGDEGGFAPNLRSNVEALDTILEAMNKAGYKVGSDILLGLDVASSEFFKDGKYDLEGEGKVYTPAQFVDLLASWAQQYPIITIEDGMAEGDWDGWKLLTDKIGNKVQLVGDDMFVTNPKIFREGIDKKIANAILIKVNQIGTLVGNARSHRDGRRRQVRRDRLASLRRNRRHHHRRHRRRHHGHPDQDRFAVPHRPRGQVQPAAAHRGRVGRRGALCWSQRVPESVPPAWLSEVRRRRCCVGSP